MGVMMKSKNGLGLSAAEFPLVRLRGGASSADILAGDLGPAGGLGQYAEIKSKTMYFRIILYKKVRYKSLWRSSK